MNILTILLLGISPLFFFSAFQVSESSAAEVYQWRDAQGRVHFGDHPEHGALDATQIPLNPLDPEPSQREGYEAMQRKIEQVVTEQKHDRNQQENIEQTRRKRRERKQAKAIERCESIRERLSEIRTQWSHKRRKGYKPADKERFKQAEAKLAKQIEGLCEI